MQLPPSIIYIIGVSGCGKSTIAKALADTIHFPYFDGDDYHPAENIAKMQAGNPLNDTDRKGWLSRLQALAKKHETTGAVIACSALKETYRLQLAHDINSIHWIHLDGSFEEIKNRIQDRKNHFMPSALLQSQFKTLEKPTNAIVISVQLSVDESVSKIIKHLSQTV